MVRASRQCRARGHSVTQDRPPWLPAPPAQQRDGRGCWCPPCDRGTATLLDMACNWSFRSRSSFCRVSFSTFNVCSCDSWKSTWRCKDVMAPV